MGPGHVFWGRCPQDIPKSEILGLNVGRLTVNLEKVSRIRASIRAEHQQL